MAATSALATVSVESAGTLTVPAAVGLGSVMTMYDAVITKAENVIIQKTIGRDY